MTRPAVDVTLGGLTLRVAPCATDEETAAAVERVNARLRELEAASSKVNTQAFALQAAYDFARQLAELRAQVNTEEVRTAEALAEVAREVEAFRARIEAATQTDER